MLSTANQIADRVTERRGRNTYYIVEGTRITCVSSWRVVVEFTPGFEVDQTSLCVCVESPCLRVSREEKREGKSKREKQLKVPNEPTKGDTSNCYYLL